MPGPGGATNIGMGFTFNARDLASGPIGLLAGNFNQLSGSVSQGMPRIVAGFAAMSAGLASMGAGIAGFRTAWNFAEEAGSFDRTMQSVRTIARAGASEFEDLGQAAIDAGIRTQFAPTEAAEGLRVLSQQGLIAADSTRALVPTLDFAAAGMIQVSEAAEVGMGVMNAYGMSVDQLPSIYDRLMRGTQMSALSANEFITVMGRAASSGQIFGTSLDDVIIALGSVRSAGIPATVATTAVSEAMRRLTTDRGALQTLRRYGVAVQDDAGHLRSVIDISRDFAGAISHMTEAQQAQIVSQTFGVRGMRTFNAMANVQARVNENGTVRTLQGAEAIRYYRDQLNGAAGTTEEFRRNTLATFQGQMILLEGTIQTFKTVFGRTFGVLFRPIMIGVTEVLNRFIQIWVSLGDRTQTAISVLFLLGSALAIVLGFVLTVGGAVTLLVTVLGSVIGVMAEVMAGIVVAMAPVIIAVGALIAVGYALFRAYEENLGGLGDYVDGWVSRISLAWNALTEIMTQGYFSDSIREQLGMAENSGIRPFVLSLRDLWAHVRTIGSGFMETWSQVWTNLGPVIEELRGAFGNLMTEIGGLFGGLLGGANSIPYDRFSSFGSMLANIVGGALRFLIQSLTTAIRIFMGIYRVIQFLSPAIEFLFSTWLENMRPIIWVFQQIWRILQAIGQYTRWLSPLTWASEGLQYLGRQGEPGTGLASERRATAEERQLSMMSDVTRRGEERRRTEASTTRPAAAQAETGMSFFDELSDILGETRGGAGGGRRLSNRVSLQLDRRQLAEVIQELDLDRDTGSGGVVTDEFGYQQSVSE